MSTVASIVVLIALIPAAIWRLRHEWRKGFSSPPPLKEWFKRW